MLFLIFLGEELALTSSTSLSVVSMLQHEELVKIAAKGAGRGCRDAEAGSKGVSGREGGVCRVKRKVKIILEEKGVELGFMFVSALKVPSLKQQISERY